MGVVVLVCTGRQPFHFPRQPTSTGRWLVSFASGPGWYPVGEFVALDAQAAIERAVEVLGTASDYRAEGQSKGTRLIPSGYFPRQLTFHDTHFSGDGLAATGTRWNA
jgi:hypothetical protein